MPAVSEAHDSTCETRLRALDFASASWPFFCWPRKAGRAIAARMPMIRITTRSSIRVKPFSSLLIRWESFRSMVTPPWSLWSGQTPRRSPLGGGSAGSGGTSTRESPEALRPRLATGLPLHRVLTLFSPHIDRWRDSLIPGGPASTPGPERRRGRAALARPPRENFGRRLADYHWLPWASATLQPPCPAFEQVRCETPVASFSM